MIDNFAVSLKVMGLGMLGIGSVAVVMMIVMLILTKLFPPKNEKDMEQNASKETAHSASHSSEE